MASVRCHKAPLLKCPTDSFSPKQKFLGDISVYKSRKFLSRSFTKTENSGAVRLQKQKTPGEFSAYKSRIFPVNSPFKKAENPSASSPFTKREILGDRSVDKIKKSPY